MKKLSNHTKNSIDQKPSRHLRHAKGSGRVAAVVSLPGGIDLDSRAERMNGLWEQLVNFQFDDVVLIAVCTSCER